MGALAPASYDAGRSISVFVCTACGAVIDRAYEETHTDWHKDLAIWIRALRDEKADA